MIRRKLPPKLLFFGEKVPLRADQPYIRMDGPLILGLFVFLASTTFVLITLYMLYPGARLPSSAAPLLFHIKHFWQVWIGKALFFIPALSDNSYLAYIGNLEGYDFALLFLKWLIALGVGGYLGYKTVRKTMHIQSGIRHERGPQLLEGVEAYEDLAKALTPDARVKDNDSGLVFLAKNQFKANPSKPELLPTPQQYDPRRSLKKPDELYPTSPYIPFPEDRRRAHCLVMAGSGRGKTQLINYLFSSPIYARIKAGDKWKLIIADTPKGDYGKQFWKKDQYILGPTVEGGAVWDLPTDLKTVSQATSYWYGLIPEQSDKDKIWSDAARMIGSACTIFLQSITPKDFNFGMHALLMTMPSKQMSTHIAPYYEITSKIFNSAPETIASVDFNLNTYAANIMRLAEIYDGYKTKKEICQATAKALKSPKFIEFIFAAMNWNPNIPDQEITHLAFKSVLFKAICLHLNDSNPKWTWAHFAEIIKQPPREQIKTVEDVLSADEKNLLEGMFLKHWEKTCAHILHYYKIWDELEAQEKFSIRAWMLDENPRKKVLMLRPNEGESKLTRSFISGILNYINQVILDDLADSDTRRVQFIIDELQSYGSLERFLGPAQEMYRSRGCGLCLAFQDISQMRKIYGEDFVKFMNANTNNLFILGMQLGDTSKGLSELIGDRTIAKTHITTDKEGGRSVSEQSHPERVIAADDFNLLGAKRRLGIANFLYIGGQLPNVYELQIPLLGYKKRSEYEKNPVLDEPTYLADPPSIKTIWEATKVADSVMSSHSESRSPSLDKASDEEDFDPID